MLAMVIFLLFLIFKFYFICMSVLSARMSVHHMYAGPVVPEEGIRNPGTGVTGGCESPWNQTLILLKSNQCS